MNKNQWSEGVVLSSQRFRRGYGKSQANVSSFDTRLRVRVLWGVYVVVVAIITAKILYLQTIDHQSQQLSAYSNHVEMQRQLAERGKILDRRDIELAPTKANAPVVGYLAEVVSEEVGCFEGLCYSPGMMIGRAGIHKSQEARLRGQDGGRLIEVDATGREVRELGSNSAERGSDVELTIDSRLQASMYEALASSRGAAVALDLQGKVLGLVSSPAYDPTNLPVYLQDSDELYFLNRAISGTYPPGSVFKLVTALAGLAQGKITSETQYEDSGEIRVGEYRYGNWYFDQYGKTEGSLDVVRALSRSNDIYFYRVGEAMGVDALVKWARRFGLGEKTGIELAGEVSGFVPDRLWKERKMGEKWFLGNTYHLAIGQGDLLVTPAQVARMTLAAVSGRLCQLSVLRDKEIACSDLGLSSEDISLVREGMRQACSTGGTAFPFFDFEPWILCKTGTAQHSGQKEEEDKPHAWITVAYPGENPELILTVMLEAAGEGSAEAGPVAKTILERWNELGK